jgi:hypothetical protein
MFLLWSFQMWLCYFVGSLVGIMTSLQAEWLDVWFLQLGRLFSLPETLQTGSGSHTASCSVGNSDPFLPGRGKGGRQQLRHKAHHSPHSVKIKKFCDVPPLPTCHHGMHSNSYNLYILLLLHLIYQDICVVIYMSCMARVLIMTICHHRWVCTASSTVGTRSVFTDEEHLEWWDDYLSPFLWSGIHELSSLRLLHTLLHGSCILITLSHFCFDIILWYCTLYRQWLVKR